MVGAMVIHTEKMNHESHQMAIEEMRTRVMTHWYWET